MPAVHFRYADVGGRRLFYREAGPADAPTLVLLHGFPDPTGTGQARWTMRWKPALNAFAITFSDRLPAAETY